MIVVMTVAVPMSTVMTVPMAMMTVPMMTMVMVVAMMSVTTVTPVGGCDVRHPGCERERTDDCQCQHDSLEHGGSPHESVNGNSGGR
jgi:hypothetical protein